MDIQDNHAAVGPQGLMTQGVMTQGFATQGFATQGFATDGLAAPRHTAQGFTTEDIVWALGIWSVILSLSPVIVFYMLMVA